MNIRAESSWFAGKFYSLDPLAEPLIVASIGNGCDTLFWFDNWNSAGSLYLKFPESLLNKQSRVVDLIKNDDWNWPRGLGKEDTLRWLRSFKKLSLVVYFNTCTEVMISIWLLPPLEFSTQSAMKKLLPVVHFNT